MAEVKIDWLSDYSDCDQAGCSGGYAEGARVFIDGELALDLEPVATCFGSESDWDERKVFTLLLEKLGHSLECD